MTLFSRKRKSLNRQFPYIVEALADLPEGTIVDGELVALADSGRPNFSLLLNFRSEASRIHFYIFDLLCCNDCDLTRLPLSERRALLKALVVIRDKKIRISDHVKAAATDLLSAVREQRLEGIVGKRMDSVYEPGMEEMEECSQGRVSTILPAHPHKGGREGADIAKLLWLSSRLAFGRFRNFLT